MNIEIEIINQGIFALATVSINGVKMLTLPFTSIEDAEKWAESCKSNIESLAKECDCPKCRAEKEAEATKPEPEEPAPAWTPEVGMLIQSEKYGVWEITGILTNGASLERVSDKLRSNSPNCELAKYRPIAELEGLKVEDNVYAIRNNGNVHEYFISANYDNTFWIESESVKFRIGIDGVPLHFGNGKQMFWRTAGRAERFG